MNLAIVGHGNTGHKTIASAISLSPRGLIEPLWPWPLVPPRAENLAEIGGVREPEGLVQRAYARN
jgi:hypothetical protein